MGKKKNKHSTISNSSYAIENKSNMCGSVIADHSSNKENNVVFEKYYPDTKRVVGRDCYVHSLCQVCKENLKERVVCSKCQLISYCSQKHRFEHWPTHADLCAAVVEICQQRQVNHIMQGAQYQSPDHFRTFRFRNMIDCENKVERSLENWEREMFIFPNMCGTCGEFKIQSLVVCKHCLHSGYCETHQNNNHQDWCEQLLLYKKIVKEQANSGVVCLSIPKCKISIVSPQLLSMESVFKDIRKQINEYEYFELTDIVSYPLTALQVLLNCNISNINELTLHIVGAESDFEIYKLEKWEYYILHLMPELNTLNIEFVGPELNVSCKTISHQVCNQCLNINKSITFNFHNELYHTICKNSKISKPNIICVFNPGLYRVTGFKNQNTWSPSIMEMLNQNCPILITAYTEKEILLDVKTIKSIQKVHLEIEPTRNPFSSQKPSLNFVSDEDSPVIFKNNFYCVINKM